MGEAPTLHCWMFARILAWVEWEGREGGGAGCQVCGPLESADSLWVWRPVPLKENGREISKGSREGGGYAGCGAA